MRQYKKSRVLNEQIDNTINAIEKKNNKKHKGGLTFRGRSKQSKRLMRRAMKEMARKEILKRHRDS